MKADIGFDLEMTSIDEGVFFSYVSFENRSCW